MPPCAVPISDHHRMEYTYQLYGLRTRLSRPLPGLMPADGPDAIDLRIDLDGSGHNRFETLPKKLWYASKKDRYGNFAHVWKLAGDAFYRFKYSDGADFVIDRSGSRIWASWPTALSEEDIFTYLTGHILAFTLGLRGYVCLHASAISVAGKAVALIAPGGGGKSTTAAVFARLGFAVITDDILVLSPRQNAYMVQPGYPRINLWPASIQALSGICEDLPRIVPQSPSYTKRYLDLTQGWSRFQHKPLPLAAFYTGESIPPSRQPSITGVAAKNTMMVLASQLYRFPLIGRADLKKEFDHLANIATRIPLRSIAFHRKLSRIDELCQTILEDFRALQRSKSKSIAVVDEAVI